MSAFALPTPSLREAVEPPERRGLARDEVRMLVTDRSTGTHAHVQFAELAAFLRAGDLLVVNDSATLPAAIPALRADGLQLMLHLSTKIDDRIWMTEPRGTVLCGEELQLPHGGSVVTIAPVEPEQPRLWYAWFQLPKPMHEYLARFGAPIRYGYVTQRFPLQDYQTIFARESGSSEMPSAARPFTLRVLHALEQRGVELATITLHCGVASFEEPERPAIERYAVPQATADAINAARKERRRVIAVGTTVVRALESSMQDRALITSRGWTDLVIDERHRMQAVDALLTGFHSGTATHQAILRAFVDPPLLAEAYDVAAEHGYYCHEFGDVHLLL
jgi:S-adenosylmethionine:tRNA ribosyltransferase-isomerase